MNTKLFDSSIISTAEQAVEFIGNILESSTEYSILGEDLDGKILLWNEGARRLFGYAPEEVVGKANSSILHVPDDVQAGKHREIRQTALRDGKWEGTLMRARKNGEHFTARLVITPRRNSAGKAIGYLLISKDISVEIRLTEELKATPFYARSLLDQQKFKQVLYNLVSNDIKFTDDGGGVEISAEPLGMRRFKLSVKDNGIGIKPEDIQRLFREFEQLESGASRRYEGTGLGLALTRKIVELQGGVINVESEVGKGSTFSVVLPLTTEAGQP